MSPRDVPDDLSSGVSGEPVECCCAELGREQQPFTMPSGHRGCLFCDRSRHDCGVVGGWIADGLIFAMNCPACAADLAPSHQRVTLRDEVSEYLLTDPEGDGEEKLPGPVSRTYALGVLNAETDAAMFRVTGLYRKRRCRHCREMLFSLGQAWLCADCD